MRDVSGLRPSARHPFRSTVQRLLLTALTACLITGCAPRTEGPVRLNSKTYSSHDRVLEIRQAPHDEKRAIALISLKTLSPPEDLARFMNDAQIYGRRVGADDCAIEVVPNPLGGFVFHGYLQVGRWREVQDAMEGLTGGAGGGSTQAILQQLLKTMRE